MKTWSKKMLSLLLCVWMLIALAVPAMAYGGIDTSHKANLTLMYRFDDNGTKIPIPNAEFRVYKVANVTVSGGFVPVAPFSGYSLKLDGKTAEEWNKIATELSGYATSGKATAVASGKTDENGTLSLKELATGLYLVAGEKCVYNKYTYTPVPAVIMLPGANAAKDEWVYDVSVSLKMERKAVPEEPAKTVSRKVLKKWE